MYKGHIHLLETSLFEYSLVWIMMLVCTKNHVIEGTTQRRPDACGDLSALQSCTLIYILPN